MTIVSRRCPNTAAERRPSVGARTGRRVHCAGSLEESVGVERNGEVLWTGERTGEPADGGCSDNRRVDRHEASQPQSEDRNSECSGCKRGETKDPGWFVSGRARDDDGPRMGRYQRHNSIGSAGKIRDSVIDPGEPKDCRVCPFVGHQSDREGEGERTASTNEGRVDHRDREMHALYPTSAISRTRSEGLAVEGRLAVPVVVLRTGVADRSTIRQVNTARVSCGLARVSNWLDRPAKR